MIPLIQLNPPLPLRVVAGCGWKGPLGNCMAVGWFQESIDHHLTFVVIMDETGQFWEVEQTNVRARTNLTWGRPNPEGSSKGVQHGDSAGSV